MLRKWLFQVVFIISILLLVLTGTIYVLSYQSVKEGFNQSVYSRRELVSSATAVLVNNQLDHIIDHGRISTANPEVVRLLKAEKWSEAIKYFVDIPAELPLVDRIFLANSKGIELADYPAAPNVIGRDFSHRDWYKGVSKNWTPYISEVYKRAAFPQYNVIAIAIPVTDFDTKTVLGILVLQIRLDSFLTWSEKHKVSSDSYMYLIDKNNQIIFHPKVSLQEEIVTVSGMSAAQSVATLTSRVELTQDPVDMSSQIVAYSYLPVYGWTVAMSEPVQTAFKARDEVLRLFTAVYVAIFLLITITVALILRYLYVQQQYSQKLEEKVSERTKALSQDRAIDDAILQSIGEGLVVTDLDGKIQYVNDAFSEMLGWQRKEVMGKNIMTVAVVLDSLNEMSFELENVLLKFRSESNSPKIVSLYFKKVQRKDKTIFPARGVITSVSVKSVIKGLVLVFRDVSKEEESNKAKDEFVSIASHELRTPLTAIDGLVTMILDGEYGDVDSKIKQPLRDISTASQRLIYLVNDLLSVARMESTRLKYEVSDFLLSNEIKSCVDLLLPAAKKKGISLIVESVQPILVQIDKDKFCRILDNIVGNAIKFTDKGKVVISMKETGQSIKIMVSDTGIGIAKSDQTQLFEKFHQITSDKGRPAGTGLGLYISRQMAKKMGGDLYLKTSEVGKGSTFVIEFPKARSPIAEKTKKTLEKEAKLHPDQK